MFDCANVYCMCAESERARASHGQSFDKFHTETDTEVANQLNGCPTAFVAATFEMASLIFVCRLAFGIGKVVVACSHNCFIVCVCMFFSSSFSIYCIFAEGDNSANKTNNPIEMVCTYICMNNLYADKFK